MPMLKVWPSKSKGSLKGWLGRIPHLRRRTGTEDFEQEKTCHMQTHINNGDPIALQEFVKDVRQVLERGERVLRLRRGRFDGVLRPARAAHEAVHSHPYPSMGIVFGIGIAAGLLVHHWLSEARDDYD
jgi:DUF883 C-terminal glycine zipper region